MSNLRFPIYKGNCRKLELLIINILMFLLLLLVIFRLSTTGDFFWHARIVQEIKDGNRVIPGNFIFYGLLYISSYFSNNINFIQVTIALLCSITLTWKYSIMNTHFSKLLQNQKYIAFLSLSLLFIYAVPYQLFLSGHGFYMGRPGYTIPPNIWHNSTTIFLFPFAILLFYFSYKQLVEYDDKQNYLILILGVLNIFIKPSYFFVWSFVYPLLLLYKYKFSKRFWKSCFVVIVLLLLLASEYFAIYIVFPADSSDGVSMINPLNIFTNMRRVLGMIISLSFPIIYSILNWKHCKNSFAFWFVIFQLFVSILIAYSLQETGPRANDGNFTWQIIICVWIYFAFALYNLVGNINIQKWRVKNIFLFIIYNVHLAFGLIYLINIVLTGDYY